MALPIKKILIILGVVLAALFVIGLAVGEEQPTTAATPEPTASTAPGDDTATVQRIIDGDTIQTSSGTIRLIGIDTPERGVCGFDEATANAAKIAPAGSTVILVSGAKDDKDKYDRLLRYVANAQGQDFGAQQLKDGYAVARYDSRDGYGAHDKEAGYITIDAASPDFTCAAPEPVVAPTEEPAPAPVAPEPEPTKAAPAPTKTAPAPAPAPTKVAPAPAGEPWNSPGPDLDCPDIGHKVYITGPDYHGLDKDGDGVGCESY